MEALGREREYFTKEDLKQAYPTMEEEKFKTLMKNLRNRQKVQLRIDRTSQSDENGDNELVRSPVDSYAETQDSDGEDERTPLEILAPELQK